MRTIFGGYIFGVDGSRNQFAPAIDPDDEIIEKIVTVVAGNAGVLVVRRDPTPEIGPYDLTLYAENGRLLLMLNEFAVDGENNTRTLTNNNSRNELVSILGELYPAKAVTHDFDLVCGIFKEFSHTGTVSKDLLT